MAAIAQIIKKSPFYGPLRTVYVPLRSLFERLSEALFSLAPQAGVERYRRMQERSYDNYTKTYDDAKNLCVGMFDAHERYPYEAYLLEHYQGSRELALDFACGIGRMMSRMLKEFKHVDGVDLNASNLEYAKRYLGEMGAKPGQFDLYKSDGVGVKLPVTKMYDFIYSTIALQHIAVYAIRRRIFEDLYNLLGDDGQCCFQMGFGWDNGVHWFINRYAARSTNAGTDVCIPDDNHLAGIEEDFRSIGFRKVQFVKKSSPHPEINAEYHPTWLFIHLTK